MLQTRLKLCEKLEIIEKYGDGVDISTLASQYNVSYQAIVKIINNKENYVEYSKSVANHDVIRISPKVIPRDNKVNAFLEKANRVNLPVSRGILQSVALDCPSEDNSQFKASPGWFDKFKKRQKVPRKRLVGEAASVDEELLKKWIIENSPQLLMYEKSCVYNCDESGLYWRQLSQYTYVHPSFKGELRGMKVDKNRVSVMCRVSLTGEKRKLMMIGKYEKPQCFKDLRYDHSKLPVIYKYTGSAYMNSSIFNQWLREWDEELKQENKRILLIMDNVSGHRKYDEKHSHIDILFLPPNTTAKSQPLDAGIIKAFKDRYKKLLLDHLCEEVMQKNFDLKTALSKYTLLDAIKNVSEAWQSLPFSAIINCWKHTQISNVYEESVEVFDCDHNYTNNQ